MSVEVAPASTAQLDWLFGVDGEIGRVAVRAAQSREEYFVAALDGAPRGFLRFGRLWRVLPFLELIRVEPAWRGRGVGDALMRRWERDMAAGGARLITSSLTEGEAGPARWHERHGFQPAGALTLGPFQTAREVFVIKPLGSRAA